MDADVAKKLREPFPSEVIGKLPRVTCRDCSQRSCQKHQKAKCQTCGNYISTAHIHLDYAGHAAITDRLLQADPGWSWEPVAFGADGLPARDQMGGLWIRLTVAGVTRLGYGDAEGKNGPAAVKEAIGDALRNAAMRFGVGLDLWHKDGQLVHDDDTPSPAAQNGRQAPARQQPQRPQQTGAAAALERLWATCKDNGWDRPTVEALWLKAKGKPLAEDAPVSAITKFREHLFNLPQAELQPAAAAAVNGDPA